MGRAVCILPLDMTPEQLAKALLQPVKSVQDESKRVNPMVFQGTSTPDICGSICLGSPLAE